MSHWKKRTASMADAQSTINMGTASESEVEMQLSPHVTASNQLIGKLLPAFSHEKAMTKPKSRPSTGQRKDLTSALVIPTAANEVSDSWEGKTLPKVKSQVERTITKGNLQPQISSVPPTTAREMSSLKLVMKGKMVQKSFGNTQSSVEKASKLSILMMEEAKLPIAPPTTRTGTEITEIFSAAVPIPRTLALKPALLPCVGNVKSLPLAEKKKKLPKYKVSLKKAKAKLEPIIHEKKADSVEMEIEPHGERRQSSDMEEAQCAVRMLVQEAEVLTQDETRPSSMKRTKIKQKSSSSEIKEEIQSGSAPRSVNQIIESLWEQVNSETLSESDRRIQEIMNRVMSRGISQKTEIFQEISGEEDLSEKSEKSIQKQEIVEEEEELREEKKEEKETWVSPEYKDGKEEMTSTETEPTISEEDDVCITAVAGPWDIESFAEEDFNKLKAELNLPLHVSREDILSLKGYQVKTFSQISPSLVKKSARKSKIEMSFLSSWNDGDIITGGGKTQDSESNIIVSKPNVKQHHFCTVTSEFEIAFPFTHVGWKYHTPNRFNKDFPIKDCRQSILNEAESFEENADIEENSQENLEDWLHQTEKMFTDIELTVKGSHAPTIMTNDIHFWTLSPPKLHVQPAIIKQMMCPLYYGSFNPGRYISFESKKRIEKRSAAEKLLDNFIEKDEEEIEQLLKERLLEHKSESSRDLTAYAKEQCPNLDLTESIPHQVLHKARPLSRLLEMQNCYSDTYCIKHMDQSPPLLLPSDFESLYQEIQEHKESICEMNKRKQELAELKQCLAYYDEETEGSTENESEDIPISRLRQYFKERKSSLKRSQSAICLQKDKLLPSPKGKRKMQRTRSKSVGVTLDLQQITLKPRFGSGIFTPKKVKIMTEEKIPSRPQSEDFSESISEKSSAKMEDELSIYSSKRNILNRSEDVSSILPSDVSKIELTTDDPQKLELNKKIWEEIELLTQDIQESPDNWMFNTCRRGVLYRKVGEFEKSFADLNKVIESESTYFDAYWHRHFLYVLRGNYPSALDDLNFIQERKPTYKVFMALGVLYENMNNTNLALANYTKAVQIDSTNHLAYFYRAKLYETIGNLNYAIGDYIKTAEKNSTHTEALRKQAEYFLKIKNWNVAISKISRLLKVINDPEAFLLRAEAFIGLKIWKQALDDLSTAIHLGPSLWKAFYLRGCLLKNNPKEINRALMDLSISLLLNDTAENISCYKHRGILYVNKKCPEQAASDFVSILKFEPKNINALLNLGLIYTKNFQNFTTAISLFTNVIILNPFHIKAYQFRAQAYTKLFKYHSALKDYTRIIHMEPDNYKYYFFLGDIFLKMKKKDSASLIIKLIANVDLDIGLDMPAELATVYSYLNKSDQAMSILEEALENNPGNPHLLMSLGKAQLQAKQYEKCLNTFNTLKTIMISKRTRKLSNLADEVFYNLGLVYMGLKDYKKALGAFNRTIDINPRHASCFYHRGLTKIHLNYEQCVIDFNKALSIDPKYFEVYMSRAAYYAMKRNYPKAILNCNEGLKIYKDSVRALLYRGSIKYFIGAYKLAVVDLTKAIKLKEDCALAFFNRAICFEALDKYENALCDYSIVHLIGDDLDYNVFINRGCLYFKMGDFDNARQDFREALKLNHQDCKIIHAWGLCLHKLGKLNEAKQMFTKCLRLNCQFSDAFISRGNVYMDYVGEEETILASYDYQRAIFTKPDDVLARICLAYSLQVLGKFQKAWHQFTEAFIIDPNCEDALEGRAAVCLQMGDTYAAFQDLNAAIRINPTAVLYNNRGVVNQHMKCLRDALTDYKYAIELDPQYALAYYNAGNIYLHGRFFRQALKYFNEAIKLDPDDECALINRAVTKVMLKDVDGATSDFEQALCMCPYYAHIYFNRGNLYASLQMYELAENDFTSVLEILPDDPLTLVQRANVYGKLGKKKLAIADYRKAMEVKEKMQIE